MAEHQSRVKVKEFITTETDASNLRTEDPRGEAAFLFLSPTMSWLPCICLRTLNSFCSSFFSLHMQSLSNHSGSSDSRTAGQLLSFCMKKTIHLQSPVVSTRCSLALRLALGVPSAQRTECQLCGPILPVFPYFSF